MDDFKMILLAGFGTVGFMEWIKRLLPKAPGWVWRLSMPVLCIGLWAASMWVPVVFWGLVVLATTQLGYQGFVQFGNEIVSILKTKFLEKPEEKKGG
jgi:hypothetical protein